MKIYSLFLSCLLATSAATYAQTLQSVTDNGNTTNKPVVIDPQADAFRSFIVNRLNSSTGATSSAALSNNKTFGVLSWHPDNTMPASSYSLYFGANLLNYYNNGTTETVWRSGNMGTGSGLDADMVDGLHAPSLFRYGKGGFGDPTAYTYPAPGLYFNWSFQPANGIPGNNYGAYLYLGDLISNGTYSGMIAFGTNSGSLYTKRKVAGTWETSWRTVWDSENFDPSQYLQLTGGSITGDLTVGSTASQKQLNVNGSIKARKVKVSVTGWPDYVFDTSYQLMPLVRLKDYITSNKHLPDVLPAATVEREGIEVGEGHAMLLRKIEELTLYIIAQHEKHLEMEKKLLEMEKRLQAVGH